MNDRPERDQTIEEEDMADEQDRTEEQTGDDGGTRAKRVLTDIAPHSWEHPADKAALNALRELGLAIEDDRGEIRIQWERDRV